MNYKGSESNREAASVNAPERDAPSKDTRLQRGSIWKCPGERRSVRKLLVYREAASESAPGRDAPSESYSFYREVHLKVPRRETLRQKVTRSTERPHLKLPRRETLRQKVTRLQRGSVWKCPRERSLLDYLPSWPLVSWPPVLDFIQLWGLPWDYLDARETTASNFVFRGMRPWLQLSKASLGFPDQWNMLEGMKNRRGPVFTIVYNYWTTLRHQT